MISGNPSPRRGTSMATDFDDLIIGAPYADPNGERSGASYVVFGRLPDAAVSRTGTDIGQSLVGGDFGDTLGRARRR